MNDDELNISIRKFLKMVGVSSQREIEQAVARAMQEGAIAGTETFPARMTLEIAGLRLQAQPEADAKARANSGGPHLPLPAPHRMPVRSHPRRAFRTTSAATAAALAVSSPRSTRSAIAGSSRRRRASQCSTVPRVPRV